MKSKEFFGKLVSGYLFGHLLAMAFVVVLLCFGVKYGLDIYTHHGQAIAVPNLQGMSYDKAEEMLHNLGLTVVVSDSGYNRRMPADCVLMQTPARGALVKRGHIIYITVNSPESPSLPLPDLVDNSSLREAQAKLTALGFKLLEPQLVHGEKDWVYGIMARGRRLSAGDRAAIDIPLTLQIGDGTYDESAGDINYLENESHEDESSEETDEFEAVPETAPVE